MKIFPLIFISPIKKKAVIKSGYHDYSHRCGMLLLEKAFSYIGKPFSENDISKTSNGKPYLSDNSLYFSISHCDGMALYPKHLSELTARAYGAPAQPL